MHRDNLLCSWWKLKGEGTCKLQRSACNMCHFWIIKGVIKLNKLSFSFVQTLIKWVFDETWHVCLFKKFTRKQKQSMDVVWRREGDRLVYTLFLTAWGHDVALGGGGGGVIPCLINEIDSPSKMSNKFKEQCCLSFHRSFRWTCYLNIIFLSSLVWSACVIYKACLTSRKLKLLSSGIEILTISVPLFSIRLYGLYWVLHNRH